MCIGFNVEIVFQLLLKYVVLFNVWLYRYEIISNEFKSLGLNKVKDLATMPIGVASKMALDGDPLVKLYEAMQVITITLYILLQLFSIILLIFYF